MIAGYLENSDCPVKRYQTLPRTSAAKAKVQDETKTSHLLGVVVGMLSLTKLAA